MNDKPVPYRDAAERTVQLGPTHGILRRDRRSGHTCHPPGWWHRLALRLVGRTVRADDLWRCRCGRVWAAYVVYQGGVADTLIWKETTIAVWEAYGGSSDETAEPDR